MTGRQREYFFQRYYFFDEGTPYNLKYEKAIRRLFEGKGLAAPRFNHFNLSSCPVTPSLYLDVLNYLDTCYLPRLDNIRSQTWYSIASSVPSVPMGVLLSERLIRQSGILLRLLPVLLLVGVAVFCFAVL